MAFKRSYLIAFGITTCLVANYSGTPEYVYKRYMAYFPRIVLFGHIRLIVLRTMYAGSWKWNGPRL